MTARADHIVLAWRGADPEASAAAAVVRRRMGGEAGWREVGLGPGLRVWCRQGGRLDVKALPRGGGLILGDLFATPGQATLSPLREGGPVLPAPPDLARGLVRAHWGQYLAILVDGEGDASLFRDPSGALMALVWTLAAGVEVVASDLHATPGWLRPPRYGLDWTRIGAFVAAPSPAAVAPLFDGVETVLAGDLRELCRHPARTQVIWRPSDYATADPVPPASAAEGLRQAVDLSTATLAARYPSLAADLSGGLDSAIIAGSLHRQGYAGQVRAWVNRHAARPEGDERRYARAVTERMGARLTEVAKPLTPILPEDFAELAAATWPALNGTDPARDRDMAERLQTLGVDALLSGQGGDAVFFQMPSALVAADAWRSQGLALFRSPVLRALADRSRTSVWDILAQGARALAAPDPLPPVLGGLVSRDVRDANRDLRHPWVAAALEAGLGPARALQVRALSNAQIYRTDCRRRRVADLVFPLMTQPVIEHCLRIPIADLAASPYDRPFARDTFAADLPDIVRRRRSKGSLTAHFAQWVAASLETLRPFLLDGCLAEAGVLDRARLDRALDRQALLWAPDPGQILNTAMTEAWVRYWQTRAPDSLTSPRDRLAAGR